MMLFRSAKNSDLPAIYHLAEQSGIGITTLPKDMEILSKRLTWSTSSFNQTVNHPKNEYYLFVLENPANNKVVGTSAIEAATGHDLPFYSYKISRHSSMCHSLNIRSDYDVLNLVNDNQERSEICTLFLDPTYRHNYNGLLLSTARFLFMAHYPSRFCSHVIAEIRGICDTEGHSPFWDAVGSHFFHTTFYDADKLTVSTNKQFISDLIPRNPLYIKTLTPAAQAVIGKPHQSSMSAMNILLREGFRYNDYVDIFDAGPTIEAPLDKIRTIAASKIMTIKNIIDEVSSKRFILSNTKLKFRATVSHAMFIEKQNACILSKETAELLQLKIGDCIRIAPLQTGDTTLFPKASHEQHSKNN